MSRGGFRPGSGRKKGGHNPKPAQKSQEAIDRDQIRQLLSLGIQAKKKLFLEYMIRVKNEDKQQKPLSIVEKKHMEKIEADLAATEEDGNPGPVDVSESDPLEYMLEVMRDPKADQETRLRAASLAAPYVHARKGEGVGKKEEKGERAAKAGQGKFAPSKPPLALVK